MLIKKSLIEFFSVILYQIYAGKANQKIVFPTFYI